MANVQINQLPGAVVPLDGTELIPADQGIQTVQITVQDIVTFANSTLPYKVYTALLTQGGSTAPVAIELENTLGITINWVYNDIGWYSSSTGGFFNVNTTTILTNITNGGITLISAVNSGEIDLFSRNFSGVGLDGCINSMTLEIRVYN